MRPLYCFQYKDLQSAKGLVRGKVKQAACLHEKALCQAVERLFLLPQRMWRRVHVEGQLVAELPALSASLFNNDHGILVRMGPSINRGPTYAPQVLQSVLYLPTYQPTNLPTSQPPNLPTYQRTNLPTYQPTNVPTYPPANLPAYQPANLPTCQPTYLHSTYLPTYLPTCLPACMHACMHDVTLHSITVHACIHYVTLRYVTLYSITLHTCMRPRVHLEGSL